MPEVQICDIPVEFPYEPYECQMAYMEKVIEALKGGSNALLESPTGTGKTLCLLCASLAYVKYAKSKLSVDATGNVTGTSSGSLYPKIIYASRTHSQLSQVVRELNKTLYKDTKTVTFGSRDVLCLNKIVTSEKNSTMKTLMCRNLTKNRKCRFYNELEKQGKQGLELIFNAEGKVLDIEDTIKIGQKHSICPFYRMRTMCDDADLILVPYNYVVDARLRKSNEINIEGNVVIFDEAHNLEAICEESASYSFTSKQLSKCIKEAKTVLKSVLEDEEEIRSKMDKSDAPFGAAITDEKGTASDEISINKNDLGSLLEILLAFEQNMQRLIPSPASAGKSSESGERDDSERNKCYNGTELVKLFKRSGIPYVKRDDILVLIDKIGQYMVSKAGVGQNNLLVDKGEHLKEFASLIEIGFTSSAQSADCQRRFLSAKENGLIDKYYCNPDADKFKLYVTMEGDLITLNYWCFSASIAMRLLCERKVRSLIVTSGTLSPIDAFVNALGIDMRIIHSNNHVASSDQILCASITHSAEQRELLGVYEKRDDPEYHRGVGRIVARLCEIVPEGILIFFASYSKMFTCIQNWKKYIGNKNGKTIWEEMNMSKKLFEESKLKEGTNEAIRQYKLHVAQSNGAALLAVCRGKISEGLDLSDSESRAVVMIGLPFAPTRDPRIKLKKEFKAAISSNNWSVMDAMRAVNQAVGRVLRHKDDFGVVALIDKRFGEYEKECPTWMRSSFENYKTFADFEVKCKKFFADHGYRNCQKETLKESAHGMVNIRKRKVDECDSNTNSKAIKKDSSVAGIYASYYRSYNQPPPQQPVTETPTQKSTSILDNIVEKDEWQRNAVIEPSRTSASSTAVSSGHSIASYTFQQVPSGTSRKTVKLKPNSSRPPKKVVAEASTSGQSSKSSHGVSIPPQYQHTPAAKIAILLSGIPNESVRLKAVVDIKVYFKKNDAKVFISQLSSTLCEYPDLLSEIFRILLKPEHRPLLQEINVQSK